MSTFEYKTICAPRKAAKIKGVKGTDARYAHTLTDVINEQAENGWEYFRAETLPVDEKTGMIGKTAERYISFLIFRRENIETYENPSISAEITTDAEPQPVVLQTPSVNEEPAGEVGNLGPATR